MRRGALGVLTEVIISSDMYETEMEIIQGMENPNDLRMQWNGMERKVSLKWKKFTEWNIYTELWLIK